METPPFQQTRVGGETVGNAKHDENIRVAQRSIGAMAPQIEEVVAQ